MMDICSYDWRCYFVYIFTDWPWSTVKRLRSGDPSIQSSTEGSCAGLVLRFVFAILHLVSIIVGMVFQMITCFRRDNPFISWVEANEGISPGSNLPHQFITNQSLEGFCELNVNTYHENTCPLQCNINQEFITTLLFPDIIIICLAFWVHCSSILNLSENSGFQFKKNRLTDDEGNQDQHIDEKIFQPIATYVLISIIYITLSLSLNVFYLYIFGIKMENIKQSPFASIKEKYLNQYVLFNSNAIFIPLLVGLIGFDLLYVKIITGYIYRCQLIIFHLKIIKKKLKKQGSTFIDNTFEKYINKLNSSSINVAAVILIAGFAATTCIFDLFNTINKSSCPKDNPDYNLMQFMQIVVVTSRSILWGWLILIPFLKAAEVNIILSRIRSHLVMNNNRKSLRIFEPPDVKIRLIGIAVDQGQAYFVVFLLLLVIMIGENIKWYKIL